MRPVSSGIVRSAEPGPTLTGKYYVETLLAGKDAIDAIEFMPDGKCVVTLGDKGNAVAGSFRGIFNGKLTIAYGDPKAVRSFGAVLIGRMLKLTDRNDLESYYILRPDPPRPKAEELMGTFSVRRETPDYIEMYVYTRTPDHLTKTLFRLVSKADRTYRDFHLTSKWTYADGISVYTVTETDMPPESRWVYSRDFIARRDEKGIWSIDAGTGNYACEVPTDKWELPPPPSGFRKAE